MGKGRLAGLRRGGGTKIPAAQNQHQHGRLRPSFGHVGAAHAGLERHRRADQGRCPPATRHLRPQARRTGRPARPRRLAQDESGPRQRHVDRGIPSGLRSRPLLARVVQLLAEDPGQHLDPGRQAIRGSGPVGSVWEGCSTIHRRGFDQWRHDIRRVRPGHQERPCFMGGDRRQPRRRD